MSFVSWQYPLLLALVYLLYWRVSQRPRIFVLIAASYYFYACWDIRFLALILSTTCLDYLCGRAIRGEWQSLPRSLGFFFAPAAWLGVCWLVPGIEAISPVTIAVAAAFGGLVCGTYHWIRQLPENRRPKAVLLLSITVNLLILGFFKYYGFFVESLDSLLGTLGLSPTLPILNILLPVGISFYTFQSLSYSIDVYRGKTEPCWGLPEYAAYISFFPQLVAGPIERSTSLLPQILTKRSFETEHLTTGCRLILTGYFKKVFVADNCALIANYAFEPGTDLNGYWAVLGVVAFAFQIYGDFSGYTDIARGSARLFGITLQQNFRFPYLAMGPSDFWQRWHISLSSWFRDYVYIPLGGNRRGVSRTLINLLLTMGIAGLWHGASWNFVLWGLYHGVILVLYRVTPGLRSLEGTESVPWWKQVAAIPSMFLLTLLGWALFRSYEIAQFENWFAALGIWDESAAVEWYRPMKYLLFHTIPLLLLQAASLRQADEAAFGRFHWVIRALIYVGMIILIAGSPRSDQEFIYFQF
ncbi:MAG: MBOAT family O-acyltransferase [Verrucomicrobiota bacterium]